MVTIYQVYSDMDLESNSGGIVVYIDNNYEYSIMNDWMYKIKSDKKNELFLCVTYRSPNSRDDNNKQEKFIIFLVFILYIQSLYYIHNYYLYKEQYTSWVRFKINVTIYLIYVTTQIRLWKFNPHMLKVILQTFVLN